MNTGRLITTGGPLLAHLWSMSKKVHHGELVKAYLDRFGYTKAAVARNASMSKQGLNNLFDSERIESGTLVRLSKAINHDLLADIEQAEAEQNEVQEPAAPYKKPASDPVEVVIKVDPNDRAKLRRIMNFLTTLAD